MDLSYILSEVVKSESSDLHLTVGKPPILRLKDGLLYPVDKLPSLKTEDIDQIIKEIAPKYRLDTFFQEKEVDFSYGIK